MKKLLITALIFISNILISQQINVKDYGAKGDGKTDDTIAFLSAIRYANKTFADKKNASLIYIPSGTYILSSSIVLNKYVSIEGEFVNNTILRMKTANRELVILEKNRDESVIYNSYNYIKNLTLQGPTFTESPFTEKNNLSNQNSVGIKVLGLRTRINDVQIDGFTNSGIEIKAVYYTYINNCFIKNNGIGVVVDELSTSAFITNNELRFNSIAIHLKGNSFANFINNNMIESNIARYIAYDLTENYEKPFSTGKGILLESSDANIITSNYFENQFVNISINNSNKNNINNNFIAIGDTTVNKDKNQISLQLMGQSKYNSFENNTFMTTKPILNSNKIIISKDDLSSNKINIGDDNTKLKNNLNIQFKDSKRLPKISD